MNEFISSIKKDWAKAKKGFDSFMEKADGQEEYQNIQARQASARAELAKKILAQNPDADQLESWLKDYGTLCYQDGFSQGYLEGNMAGSESME